jgi:hypothetical protein
MISTWMMMQKIAAIAITAASIPAIILELAFFGAKKTRHHGTRSGHQTGAVLGCWIPINP